MTKAGKYAAALHQQPKVFLRHTGSSADWIVANRHFLLGDYQEQAVERLLRQVVLDPGLFGVYQAQLHAPAGNLVVLLGQSGLGGDPGDNRQKVLRQLITGGPAEILGCGGFTTSKYSPGVLKTHAPDGIDQQRFRQRHNLLRSPVHRRHQFIRLLLQAQYAQRTLNALQGVGQRDPDFVIGEKTVFRTQSGNGDGRTLGT